jgi:hypothetical protein
MCGAKLGNPEHNKTKSIQPEQLDGEPIQNNHIFVSFHQQN